MDEYAYVYDDIGNRLSSTEPDDVLEYTANNLNQYSLVVGRGVPSAPPEDNFEPQYDADGNQTLVKTSTDVWQVTYNGENRPVMWTCGATNLTMKFDRMGRRVEYLETVADAADDTIATNKHQRFVYDGYLCLQIVNAQTGVAEYAFEWDPTEPVATRPMVMQRTGNWNLFYTHDGNKNVSELVYYQRARGVAAHYEYAPFGTVTVQTRGDGWGTLDFSSLNPFRFSSEFADDALGLVYYNYRHYEPLTGRWLSRDPIGERGGVNSYAYLENNIALTDLLGLGFWGDLWQDIEWYFRSLKHFIDGIRAGMAVRDWFLENKHNYECCPEGVDAPVGLERYDGVKDNSRSSWTIAHRITGCVLKAAGLSYEEVCVLNGYHETFEFFRPWRPEFLAFMEKENIKGLDYDALIKEIETSLREYLNDTIKDINAVMEGFYSDGCNCYEKFIPQECKRK